MVPGVPFTISSICSVKSAEVSAIHGVAPEGTVCVCENDKDWCEVAVAFWDISAFSQHDYLFRALLCKTPKYVGRSPAALAFLHVEFALMNTA